MFTEIEHDYIVHHCF